MSDYPYLIGDLPTYKRTVEGFDTAKVKRKNLWLCYRCFKLTSAPQLRQILEVYEREFGLSCDFCANPAKVRIKFIKMSPLQMIREIEKNG